MALTDNLLAYYKLDEASGNAADATGNGYTLTNTGVTFSSGALNNGADFGAAGDKLENADTAFDFQGSSAFSVSVWLDLVAVGSNQFLVSNQRDTGDYQGWGLYQSDSGRILFGMIQDLSPLYWINVKTPQSQIGTTYAHVVLTKSTSTTASGIHIYINGSDQSLTVDGDTFTGTITYNSNLELGNRGTGYNFNGQLDEVGIWNRELTSGEVTSLYNSGTPLPFDDFDGGGGDIFLPHATWFM